MEAEEGKEGAAASNDPTTPSAAEAPSPTTTPSGAAANSKTLKPSTPTKNEAASKEAPHDGKRGRKNVSENAWERLTRSSRGHSRNHRQEAQNRKGKDSIELRQRVRTRSQREDGEAEGDANLRTKAANNVAQNQKPSTPSPVDEADVALEVGAEKEAESVVIEP
ncbi:hypothetical protein CAPTEDRAFT_210698, partial [Capitella teleta]